MPTHQRIGLEDDRGSEQAGKQSIEPDEDHPICSAQPQPWWCGSLQDKKLLAKEHDLGIASRTRSKQSDEPSAEQFEEVDHLGVKPAHRCICATPDKIFGWYSQAERLKAARLPGRDGFYVLFAAAAPA
jgi:hypothetical protein